jgi:hypothetical protein
MVYEKATRFGRWAKIANVEKDRPPIQHRSALLLVDVINHFDFPGGDKLLDAALRIAPAIRADSRAEPGWHRYRLSMSMIISDSGVPALNNY